MDKAASLSLLKEMVQTTKITTSGYPTSFYVLLRRFVQDLGRVTNQVHDGDLRLVQLRLLSVASIGKVCWDYQLQQYAKPVIEELTRSDPAELRELAVYAVCRVDIDVLSDIDGRDALDVEEIHSGLVRVLPWLDDASKTYVFSKLAEALRRVQLGFAKHVGTELNEFYNAVTMAADKDWSDVLAEVDKYVIELDREAMIWLRR